MGLPHTVYGFGVNPASMRFIVIVNLCVTKESVLYHNVGIMASRIKKANKGVLNPNYNQGGAIVVIN